MTVWEGAIQPSYRFHFNQLSYLSIVISIILRVCVSRGHTAISQFFNHFIILSHRAMTIQPTVLCKRNESELRRNSAKFANFGEQIAIFRFRRKFGEISARLLYLSPCEISEARWWTETKVGSMNNEFQESFTKFWVINEISARRTEISCERNEISLLRSS